MEELKVNIGAGNTYIPSFVNIDISPRADISLNLNIDELPFEDNTVDLVFTYHTLEHLDNYLFALGEIHRVLKHRGHLLIGVPYVTLTRNHLVNPYHRQNFNEYSFDFFDIEKLKGSAVEANPILFKKVFHRFQYVGIFKMLPIFRNLCRQLLFNVVRTIDFGLLAIKPPHRILHVNQEDEDHMRREFDECLSKRVPYPKRFHSLLTPLPYLLEQDARAECS